MNRERKPIFQVIRKAVLPGSLAILYALTASPVEGRLNTPTKMVCSIPRGEYLLPDELGGWEIPNAPCEERFPVYVPDLKRNVMTDTAGWIDVTPLPDGRMPVPFKKFCLRRCEVLPQE